MTTIHRLELARNGDARPVDLLDIAAVYDKEAEVMTFTAVDLTAELSRVTAARARAISGDTIKRRQKAGSFPNARQVGLDRSWVIPVRDLVDAGLLPAAALALPAQPRHLDVPASRYQPRDDTLLTFLEAPAIMPPSERERGRTIHCCVTRSPPPTHAVSA